MAYHKHKMNWILILGVIFSFCCAKEIKYNVILDSGIHKNRMGTNALFKAHISKVKSFLKEGEKITDILNFGYTARVGKDTAKKIKNDPDVKIMEEDTPVSIDNINIHNDSIVVQRPAPWGLIKITGDTKFFHGAYKYLEHAGKDVTVYVLDTGIEVEHPDFNGRASWGANFVEGSLDTDENGHGTHCAGTIGGQYFGVSKNTKIVAVKILDKTGLGMTSNILRGIDFVINEHDKKMDELFEKEIKQKLAEIEESSTSLEFVEFENILGENTITIPIRKQHKTKSIFKDFEKRKDLVPKTIINMSLGGIRSSVLNFAVDYATKIGIHFSLSAGNEHQNACNFSPGSSNSGITTGAATYQETTASFSNFGECVDLYAPGVDILSSWINKTQKIVSGTSMATPHTTGVMAAYLTYFDLTPQELKKKLLDDAYIFVNDNTSKKAGFGLWPFRNIFGDSELKKPFLTIKKLIDISKEKID